MTKEEFREQMSKALYLLNDIDLQNKLISLIPNSSEDFLPDFIKKRMAMGEIDEWLNADGEFGRTPTNPILVNRTWGEITYLSRLLTADGQHMVFHRVGSVIGAIDAFELVSADGKFSDVLYVDMYHHHCSKKAPLGYSLVEFLDGITGTSENVPDFPEQALDAIAKTAVNKFDAPIISPSIWEFDVVAARKLLETSRQGNNLDGKILSKMTI